MKAVREFEGLDAAGFCASTEMRSQDVSKPYSNNAEAHKIFECDILDLTEEVLLFRVNYNQSSITEPASS